jgi:signal transduction histidine kinase
VVIKWLGPAGAIVLTFRAGDIFAAVEAASAIPPALPFWETAWFWATAAGSALLTAGGCYLAWRRGQSAVKRRQEEHSLENERVRIAQDLHDDLGARVTQISLLSDMAQSIPNLPEKARADFDRIAHMARDLITALHDTVWAVDPENDNLDALGNYLSQIVGQLCSQAQLRYRVHMEELPGDVYVSSQTRHNIAMTVKEVMHNVIKHARASEVNLRAAYLGSVLIVSLDDNGCGFQANGSLPGNGLKNMRRRLQEIGGTCIIESVIDRGTTVRLRLELAPASRPQ